MEKSEVKSSETAVSKIHSLPNLHEAKLSFRELSSEYWTPENEGDYRVGVLLNINEEPYEDEKTGETVMLPCIIFLSQNQDGTFKTIKNGSKRLVATMESNLESGEIELETTPIRITFNGKKKNKTNGFNSDTWSVKPILL
jgi:hypothetical protein